MHLDNITLNLNLNSVNQIITFVRCVNYTIALNNCRLGIINPGLMVLNPVSPDMEAVPEEALQIRSCYGYGYCPPDSPGFGSSTERPNDQTASISSSLVRKAYLEHPVDFHTSHLCRVGTYGHVMIFRGFGYLESRDSTCFCFSRLRCPASASIGYLDNCVRCRLADRWT